MRPSSLPALFLALALLPALPAAAGVAVDEATLGALAARPLGPALMSGRVTSIDGRPGTPPEIWVGTAGGGAWKSTDGGITFEPVFDDRASSIGIVRLDPDDPRVAWVGTGESWTRNSVGVGNGIWRTTDGGTTWEHLGLEHSERIADIELLPGNPRVVLACALGPLWNSGGERGVYRSEDGGKTWERVLFVDDDTGCADLAVDPGEPRTVYAATWTFRRTPWSFSSGGPGSGLWKSTDGGKTWRRLGPETGLPEGPLGRIAVAVAPSRPNRVYATVEAAETGLWASDDSGRHWERVSTAFPVQARPFYFSFLAVHPRDHRRLVKAGFLPATSRDGGRTWQGALAGLGPGAGGGIHPDVHAWWFDPEHPSFQVIGTDGGVYVSEDDGIHWRHVRTLPVSQFYRVSVDDDVPYNVYGGLQDNGSWTGPSRTGHGIGPRDWRLVGWGDGFCVLRDPTEPRFVFSEYQGGHLQRLDLETGEVRDVRPLPGPGDPEFRFNWNTPLHPSRAEPGVLYLGAQFLFRSADHGETWQPISPDLTTNDPGKQRQEESGGLTVDNSTAENHCTITAIATSPVDPRVIWVGTDDGNLQVTRDGGKTWKNVVGNVPGLPDHTWVSSIEADAREAGRVFVTFDGHRSGDMEPRVYRGDDHGQRWTSLATDDLEGYLHVIRQDPVNPELLWLGSESGLFVTLDGGVHWARFSGGLPRVAVRDIAIQPREADVVLATHGRGIWIIDDVTPLRSLDEETVARDAVVLPSRDQVQLVTPPDAGFPGDAEFRGTDVPETAWIHYWLKKRHLVGRFRVEVLDADGEVVATLAGTRRRGLNRVAWPMRLPPPEVPPGNGLLPTVLGPLVPEGSYTVRVRLGDRVAAEGTIRVVADPRLRHSAADRRARHEALMRLYRDLGRLKELVARIDAGLSGARKRAREELLALRETLVAPEGGGLLAGKERLRERLGDLYAAIQGYRGRPSPGQLARLSALEQNLARAEEEAAKLLGR